MEKNPSIIEGFHSCGPGNTYNEIKKMIGEKGKYLRSFSIIRFMEKLFVG